MHPTGRRGQVLPRVDEPERDGDEGREAARLQALLPGALLLHRGLARVLPTTATQQARLETREVVYTSYVLGFLTL